MIYLLTAERSECYDAYRNISVELGFSEMNTDVYYEIKDWLRAALSYKHFLRDVFYVLHVETYYKDSVLVSWPAEIDMTRDRVLLIEVGGTNWVEVDEHDVVYKSLLSYRQININGRVLKMDKSLYGFLTRLLTEINN